jgi:hypothetical protein
LNRLLGLLKDDEKKSSYRMKVMDNATLKDAIFLHNLTY